MELIAQYDYGLAIKGRFEENGEKTFRWRMADSSAWTGLKNLNQADLPLYGVLSGDPVYLCEGEKAVDICVGMGLSAACLPGGAAAKTFGTALSALSGKTVILWPDNDKPGLEFMSRVAGAINGAASILYVTPDVPPKGDAYDYFTGGGKIEQLSPREAVENPRVEDLADGYLITIPDMEGRTYFEFLDVHERSGELSAEIKVWQEVPGRSHKPHSERINVLTQSTVTQLRRTLDERFPYSATLKGYWAGLVAEAVALFRSAHSERDWSLRLDLADVPPTLPYVIHPLLPAEGHTIFFGQAETGKTYLLLTLALVIATGTEALGYSGPARPIIFVDYEADERQIKRRLRRIIDGMEIEPQPDLFSRFFLYWPGRGPLTSMMPALRRRARDASYLFVDSVALGCGGNPKDEDVALNYSSALQRIGLPSASIAHTTKDDKDLMPYGSIFWHTSARATWNLKTPDDEHGLIKHIGLYPRKSNEDLRPKPLGFRLEFTPTFTRIDRESLSSSLYDFLPTRDRVRSLLLSRGKLTKREILDEIPDLTETALRKALQRMPDAFAEGANSPNTRWTIISTRDTGDN